MCGKAKVRATYAGDSATSDGPGWGWCGLVGAFLPPDAGRLAPRERIGAALRVLAPAAAGSLFIFAVVPRAAWVVFAFGWMFFPAVGLLARGLTGLAREAEPRLRDALHERLTASPSTGEAATLRRRLHAAADGLPRPEAREHGRRLAAAAERLAVAAGQSGDGEVAAWVSERYLRPTLLVLERYARLAQEPAAAIDPALGELEAEGLPALAVKLDRVREELERGTTIPSPIA